ncbi:class I SAM-dependent methyltransferase [Lysobacter koreensis]|uniref:Class I SAM-dependent methyltransferase n=1 Tax=Lysobacter koreensis TaxID=266122 RepID=A0ABW2YMA9_9GAMM
MSRSPEQLDQARRDWLAGLARQHASQPTAQSALALARGHWLCGDYEQAMTHFIAARDGAPAVADTHIALVRSASMLGLLELETSALQLALQLHPRQPELALQAALRQVPGDLAAARDLLQPHLQDGLCAQFDQALAAIQAGAMPAPDRSGDPQAIARQDSLRWVQRHAPDRQVHAGMPSDVLLRALDATAGSGLTLECGVYFGRSLRLIAERTHGAVHGFDSFQGLPEAWSAHEGAGAYSTAGRLPKVTANVELHAGWFEHTLPPFFAAHPGPIRLLHIDCDLYSSTRSVLDAADAHLVPGSVLVFDDFLGYPGYEQHELRAFEEYADARGLGWELIAAALLGREVALRITSR